MKVECHG
jgi:hypothetical protein